MFRIKWGVVSGVTAFALAFTLSLLLGGTGLPVALLRAAIFAGVFFGLGIGIRTLINTFIPELLLANAGGDIVSNVFSAGAAGSQVNITLDDTSNAALPDQDDDGQAADEVGHFSDLLTRAINPRKDIDQNPPKSYTEKSYTESYTEEGVEEGGVEEVAEVTPEFDSVSAKVDDLGDFSLDFGAFIPDASEGGGTGGSGDSMDSFFSSPGDSGHAEEAVPERKASGNKPMKLEGDFDAKEIAAGIRTVLEQDKKKG